MSATPTIVPALDLTAWVDALEADHAAGTCGCPDCRRDAAIVDALWADELEADALADLDAAHAEWSRGFEDVDADSYRALGR